MNNNRDNFTEGLNQLSTLRLNEQSSTQWSQKGERSDGILVLYEDDGITHNLIICKNKQKKM